MAPPRSSQILADQRLDTPKPSPGAAVRAFQKGGLYVLAVAGDLCDSQPRKAPTSSLSTKARCVCGRQMQAEVMISEKLERIEDRFDAVIFLTSSDWATEPRSNRYHYATRFARRLPVYFVQPDQPFCTMYDEESGVPNLTLVHCSWYPHLPAESGPAPKALAHDACRAARKAASPAAALERYFASKGIRRPLLWIYNFKYEDFIRAHFEDLKIFHATEDYTLDSGTFRFFDDDYKDMVIRNLMSCDMMIAVSEAVRSNYVKASGFSGVSITLPNGCDYDFWIGSEAKDFRPAQSPSMLVDERPESAHKVALYQGGINARLDFDLIEHLIRNMPDWTFWFCGRALETEQTSLEAAVWQRVLTYANVRHWGNLQPDQVAALARSATVGIAPFKSNTLVYVSLPLKAYEYVACGLPVVTAPVAALEPDAANFRIARTPSEWINAIKELGPTRRDPEALERRLRSAKAMDYSLRFSELETAAINVAHTLLLHDKTLNVVIVYDDTSHDAIAIRDHLHSLKEKSRHRYFFYPAPNGYGEDALERPAQDWPSSSDMSHFDVAVLWFSPTMLLQQPAGRSVADALRRRKGPNVLFLQNGRDAEPALFEWIATTVIDTVATGISEDAVARLYPGLHQIGVEFVGELIEPGSGGFVETFDRMLSRRVLKGSRAEIVSAPIARRVRSTDDWETLDCRRGLEFSLTTEVLIDPLKRVKMVRALERASAETADPNRGQMWPADRPSVTWSTAAEVGLESVLVTNYWRQAGAELHPAEGGVRIVTPPMAWHYAAIVKFDPMDAPPASHLVVELDCVEGEVGVSFFNEETNDICAERVVRAGRGGLVMLEADTSAPALLLRTGSLDAAASAVIRRIQWVNLDL